MQYHGLILSFSLENLSMKLLKQRLPQSKSRCIKKFLYYFPGGFRDEKYIDWERNYKWLAHVEWLEGLNKEQYQSLIKSGDHKEIVGHTIRLESKTNLLFSFEKMALRDAVREKSGAKDFAEGLFDYVYGKGPMQKRFEFFTETLSGLPRKQTKVLSWPLQTVFGFIANPQEQIFLKPKVTKTAAEKYGFDFEYQSRPNWTTYRSLLQFAKEIRNDIADLEPKDLIDIQSFIWVLGSEEYPD